MKMLKIISAILITCLSLSAFAGAPIKNLIDVAPPLNLDGSSPALEDVRSAIVAGCRARGWNPVMSGDNKIVATILVRGKFHAEVEIPYTAKGYSIIYKSSQELDYDEKKQTIHRNYNKWVEMLSASIQREFGRRS